MSDDVTSFESEDQARFLGEIVVQVMDELMARAPALDDFSEKDLIAVSTAVGKAAWRGLLRGAVTVVDQANDVWSQNYLPGLRRDLPAATLPDVFLGMTFLDPETGDAPIGPDVWADLYGADGGTGGA